MNVERGNEDISEAEIIMEETSPNVSGVEELKQPEKISGDVYRKVGRRTFLKKAALGVAGFATLLSESGESKAGEQIESGVDLFNTVISLGRRVRAVSSTYETNVDKYNGIKRAGVIQYLSDCSAEFDSKGKTIIKEDGHSLNIKIERIKQQVSQEKLFEYFVFIGKELEGDPDPKLKDYSLGKISIPPKIMEERIQEAAIRRAAAPERVLGDYEITAWQAIERGDRDISKFKNNILDVIRRESSTNKLDERVKEVTKEMAKYGFNVDENKTRRIIYGELQRRRVEWVQFFSKK